MTVFNNISNSFYSSLNNIGTNPLVLVVLIIVIIIYYVLFSFLGVNRDDDDDGIFGSGSYVIIEGLLWGIFIILIFVNGLAYFFNINLVTEFQNIFSQKPEINISTTNDFKLPTDSSSLSSSLNEVFHVPGRTFTYHDSKAVCKAFDSEIADYNQLATAQKKGASWCSYGWTKDQLGLYPTSQSDFDKLKKIEGHEYDCGLPGINGGYVANPYTRLGVNCYGVKPKKSELDAKLISEDLYPKTAKELLFEKRVKYWKDRIGNMLIMPFNNKNWFKVSSTSNSLESVYNNLNQDQLQKQEKQEKQQKQKQEKQQKQKQQKQNQDTLSNEVNENDLLKHLNNSSY